MTSTPAWQSMRRVWAVIAGTSHQDGSTVDFAVARLTTAGALDASFGTGGKTTIDFGSTGSTATTLRSTAQGRIVVAGTSRQDTEYDFAVARLTAAGALDASFGIGGKATIDFAGREDGASSVAVDAQGRIVIAGRSQGVTGYDVAVARLTAAGALDASFGAGGKFTADFGDFQDFAQSVLTDAQGRIVLAVTSNQGGPTGADFVVARLTAAGTLDASFGTGGKATVDFGGTSDFAFDVAVNSEGGIVVVGHSSQGGSTGSDFGVARLTAAGVLDSSFGTGGKVTIDFGGTHHDQGSSVAIDMQERIVVAGGGGLGLALARFSANEAPVADAAGRTLWMKGAASRSTGPVRLIRMPATR